MERSKYEAVQAMVKLPMSAIPHFKAIAHHFGVSLETVYSIYSQEVQNRVKETNHRLKELWPGHAKRYTAGEQLLELCIETDVPPCHLLRRLLEQMPLDLQHNRRVTEVLRTPSALPSLVSLAAAQQALEDSGAPASAADAQAFLRRLQADVELAVACEDVYSPASDKARSAAGREHEAKLYSNLDAAGIAYFTEEDLRGRGFHKTPDAWLQVPVGVCGRVVCWIDSKATFGDEKQHRQQLQEQYQLYINRFGPGLVLYWHGFLADLQSEEEGVLLMDRFPGAEDLTVLPQLPLTAEGGGEQGASAAAAASLATSPLGVL